jgi:hypothetical protein
MIQVEGKKKKAIACGKADNTTLINFTRIQNREK